MAESLQQASAPAAGPKSGYVAGIGDVTEEKYEGPGPAVAAAGGAFIAHWVLAFFAVIIGAVAGIAFHKPLISRIRTIQASAATAIQAAEAEGKQAGFYHRAMEWLFGTGRTKEAIAKEITDNVPTLSTTYTHKLNKAIVHEERGFFQGFAQNFIDPVVQFFYRGSKISETAEQKIEAATIGGGVLGVLTFVASTILFGGREALAAIRGKNQFERAKDEIRDLRAKSEASQGSTPARQERSDRSQLTVADDTPRRRDDHKPGTIVSAIAHEAALAPQQTNAVTT